MGVTSEPGQRQPSRVVLALVLVLGVALVFGQTLSFAFLTLDDPGYVTQNEHVLRGLDGGTLRWALFATKPALWHPLTWISHALDVQLFGLNAAGHHLGSMLLHAGSSVVLFLALDLATRARYRSFVVAALFALHPLRADSVAWVAERKDTLSTFLSLTGVLAYVHYVKAPSVRRYLLVALPIAFALLAKPMAVVDPVALLLLDAWPLGRLAFTWRSLARRVLEKAPLFALALATGMVTLHAQRNALSTAPLEDRVPNAIVAYARHIGHLFVPRKLSILYPLRQIATAEWVSSLAVLLLLGGVGVYVGRRRPYVAFGLAWFFLLLLPVSGVLQSGVGALADRFTYLPCIGLLVAVVWLAADVCEAWRVPRAVTGVLAGAVVAGCAAAAYVEVSHYQDSVTVFTHAIASTGDNMMAEQQLGNALLADGDPAAALVHFQREGAIVPGDPIAHDGAGQALESLGRSGEAIGEYEAALRVVPRDVGVRNNLCASLLSLHRDDEARACWREAIALDPNVPTLYLNLGRQDARVGRFTEAVDELERALKLNPRSPAAENELCGALLALRRYDEALACLERATALSPGSPVPYAGLARLYDETGRADLAAEARRTGAALRAATGR